MAFYRKNIGSVQQVTRIALGLAGAGAALALLPPPLGLAGAAAGATFALTGLVGYCPICAVAGVGRHDESVR